MGKDLQTYELKKKETIQELYESLPAVSEEESQLCRQQSQQQEVLRKESILWQKVKLTTGLVMLDYFQTFLDKKGQISFAKRDSKGNNLLMAYMKHGMPADP